MDKTELPSTKNTPPNKQHITERKEAKRESRSLSPGRSGRRDDYPKSKERERINDPQSGKRLPAGATLPYKWERYSQPNYHQYSKPPWTKYQVPVKSRNLINGKYSKNLELRKTSVPLPGDLKACLRCAYPGHGCQDCFANDVEPCSVPFCPQSETHATQTHFVASIWFSRKDITWAQMCKLYNEASKPGGPNLANFIRSESNPNPQNPPTGQKARDTKPPLPPKRNQSNFGRKAQGGGRNQGFFKQTTGSMSGASESDRGWDGSNQRGASQQRKNGQKKVGNAGDFASVSRGKSKERRKGSSRGESDSRSSGQSESEIDEPQKKLRRRRKKMKNRGREVSRSRSRSRGKRQKEKKKKKNEKEKEETATR